MKKLTFLLTALFFSITITAQNKTINDSSRGDIAAPALRFVTNLEDQFSTVTESITIGHIRDTKEIAFKCDKDRKYSAILVSTANLQKVAFEVYRVDNEEGPVLIDQDYKGEDPIAGVIFNTDKGITFLFKIRVLEYDPNFEKRGQYAICIMKELPKP